MKFFYKNEEIFYDIKGNGDALILLHGLPFDSRIWQPILSDLSRSYTCIILDFPGFGRSKDITKPVLFSELKDVVKELIRYLHLDSCNLLGHSFGGYVLLDFALTYPDLLKRLILVSTKASADFEEKKKERRYYAQELRNNHYSEYIKLQEDYCVTRAENQSFVSEIISQNVTYHIADLLESLVKRPSFAGLNQINVRTDIIVGENDVDFLKECNNLHSQIHSSRLHVLPNANHMVFLDDPASFLDAVRK